MRDGDEVEHEAFGELERLRVGHLSAATSAALERLAIEVGGAEAAEAIAEVPCCTPGSCACGLSLAERAHYAGVHRRKDPR